ncbi:MAG: hypothetical protein IPH36_14615 [Saprospiraceae bacterium]|nr:hypothetical protein [Saprospiraceae bacterium]
MKLLILIILTILSTSCNSQEKKINTSKNISDSDNIEIESQIGEYVTSIFEDSRVNYGFGTNGNGIARYDGKNLKYFTSNDGLPSDRVTGIIEDSKGIFWLHTGEGVSKYNGREFTNFLVGEDFGSNVVANYLLIVRTSFGLAPGMEFLDLTERCFTPFQFPTQW